MAAITTLASSILGFGQYQQQEEAERARARLNREQLALKEQQRRDLLTRQLAATRAKLGARGVSATGSATALMAGLTKETETEIGNDHRLHALSEGTSSHNSSLAGLKAGLNIIQTGRSLL